MAKRESSLRITIKNQGFLAGMRQLVTKTAQAGNKMGKALSVPMKAGFKSAVGSMKGMMDDLTGHMKTAATLGGAISVSKFVKDAIEMQTVYRNIEHNLSKVNSSVKSWRDVQEMILPIADRTGQDVGSMAQAFNVVFGATGDLEYTKAVLEGIGTVATASGQDAAKYGELMQIAYRKFGVAGEEANELLAKLDRQLGIGGLSIDDMSARFGVMATEAAEAGFKGANGMARLFGLVGALDDENATPALKQMFTLLKDGTSAAANLQKNAGIKFTADMDAIDKIRETLKTARGRKTAELTFTGDVRRVYDTLIKPFDEAVEDGKKQGLKGKALTQAGLKAFDDAIAKLGAETANYTDLQNKAAKRIEDDPTVAMRKALNKMATAFQDKRMMDAIERLAKMLPEVADGFVGIMDFILRNPMLSAGGFVGAKLGISFAQGALMSAGTKIGAAAVPLLKSGAFSAGTKMGMAAKVALVAAAAYIGFEVGKAIAEKFWSDREAMDKAASETDIAAHNALRSGDAQEQQRALKQVRDQIADLEKERSGFLGSIRQFYHDASAAGAALFGADVGYVDTNADSLAILRRAEADLVQSLKKQKDAQQETAEATEDVAVQANKLASNLGRVNGILEKVGTGAPAPGAKGPPGKLHTGPGYAQ